MNKWIFLWVSFLTACTSDEIKVPEEYGEPDKLTIRLLLPDAEPVSKATSTAAINEYEHKIDNLYVFVFKRNSKDPLDDVYLYDIQVAGSSLRNDPSIPYGKTATVSIKNMAFEQYLVLVANMPPALPLSMKKDVSTRRDLVKQLRFSGERWRTGQPDQFPLIPMWGQKNDPLLLAGNPPKTVDVKLIRALSKVELKIDVNTGDPALGFGSTFKIDSVYVCNASDSGYIAPHTEYLGNTYINKTNPATARIPQAGYAFPQIEKQLGQIYIPESDTLSMQGNTTLNTPAFIVVKAQYYNQSAPGYYRIDFVDAKGGSYKALLRNHYYQINIRGVRAEGYKSLQEAIEAPVSLLNFSLILDDKDVEINDVVYNREYMLGAYADAISLDREARGDANPVHIPVKTTYPGGWNATLESGDPSVFELMTRHGAAGSTTRLSLKIKSDNTTPSPRTAQVKLTAGMLSKHINITQSPGSNAYIMKVGETLDISAASADVDGISRSGKARSVGTVELVGTPISANASIQSGKYVAVKAQSEGNALVQLKDSKGLVLWSWHIWVVPANVDFRQPAYQRMHNGYIFMDRNLGASAADDAGLYYQWGRKDPFPQNFSSLNTFSVAPAPLQHSLDSSCMNPTVFYINPSSPHDWKGQEHHNNLWNTTTGKKGPYDPCPFGWRVPPDQNNSSSPWYGYVKGKNRLTFPGSGGFDGTNAGRKEHTAEFVWSASPQGLYAYVFHAGTASSQPANRSNAYPVRCVKE
ncbi:MAG: hypothetical protein LBQ73_00430 [Tannerellaceae bacterium]|jgi:hypothetical protein|nr:hypothetical protein [Tannerellaceae bacterium]